MWCFLPCIVFAVGAAAHTAGASVEAHDGNIYIRNDQTGTLKRVTDSRHDRTPALSPDGRQIVFVRDLAGDPDYSDFTREGPAIRVTQLWVADIAGQRPPHLVLDSPIGVRGRQFSGFYVP